MSAESTRTGTSDRRNGQHDDSDDQLVLLPQHLALIEGSGIAPDVARARGYRSCTVADDDLLRELGFTKPQRRFPGLLIPIYNAAGDLALHQYRPDHPRLVRKRSIRYETAEGSRLVLDVPRSIREQLADPTVPLVVTEGSRKVDAAISHGLVAVGVLGVDGWRGTGERGGKTVLADWGDVALNARPILLAFDSDAVTKREVARALKAFRAYLQTRDAYVRIIYLPPGSNGAKQGLDDFLAAGGSVDDLLRLAEDVVREPEDAAPTATTTAFHMSETGNSERLAHRYGKHLRFCHPWGTWLCWDGRRWERDATATVRLWAKDVVRGIYTEAAEAPSPEIRRALAEWAIKSESAHARQALIKLAEAEPGIPIKPEQLDLDPFLFTCENGTLDLRSGRLRPHDPKDNITKLAPVRYDPKATAPRFHAFLERIVPDPDVRTFLQRYLGYCLTADASEQVLLFAYGSGGNGKSTLLTLMRTVLGDYAKQAAPELLIARRGERHPTELADLFGARLVTSIEVDEGKRLAETLVKQMTGGDPMKGRFMRADFFEWMPTHKLLLAANHQPAIHGTDWAIWRRIRLVPFTVTIADGEKDPLLPTKLLAESSGILNWLLEGCLAWQRHGLGTPEAVRKATEEYRAEQDILADFLADRCILHSDTWVPTGDLYKAYTGWCDENGAKPISSIAVGKRLAERGLVAEKRRIGPRVLRLWKGLRLEGDGGVTPPADTPEEGTSEECDAFGAVTHCDAESGITGTAIRVERLSRNMRHNASHPSNASQNAATPPPGTVEEVADTVPYTLITDTAGLLTALPSLLVAPVIGFDVETAIEAGTVFTPKKSKTSKKVDQVPENTTAFDPTRGRLRLLQLATPEQTYVIDVFAVQDLSPLAPLFRSTSEFIAHNAVFDMNWIRSAGLPIPERVTCTMVLVQLVDAGRTRTGSKKRLEFGLEDVAERYLGEQLDKTLQTEDWSVPDLTPEQLAYGAKDAAVLIPLRDALTDAVRTGGLEAVAALETGLLPFMAELRSVGMHVDLARWVGLAKHAQGEADVLEPQLRAALGDPRDPKTGDPINLGSGQQLGAAFEAVGVKLPRTEKGQIRTDKYTFERRSDQHPAVNLFRAWKAAQTAVTGFGEEKLHPSPDGRVRASFRQIGTVTGRMSCADPNLQNIPKLDRYRSCFDAPPDRILVKADLALAQVCCVADISGDEALIAALNRGDDVHKRTAAALYGKAAEAVTPAERKFGKVVVFGTVFGQGDAGLIEQAARQHIQLTQREASTFLARFDRAWPGLATWRRAQMRRRDLEIRSPSGRVRYLHPDEHGTVRANSPIQMLEADGVKHGLTMLWERRAEWGTALPSNIVHDEVIFEADASDAPRIVQLLRDCLEAGMAKVLTRVTPRLDITTGPTWAESDQTGG